MSTPAITNESAGSASATPRRPVTRPATTEQLVFEKIESMLHHAQQTGKKERQEVLKQVKAEVRATLQNHSGQKREREEEVDEEPDVPKRVRQCIDGPHPEVPRTEVQRTEAAALRSALAAQEEKIKEIRSEMQRRDYWAHREIAQLSRGSDQSYQRSSKTANIRAALQDPDVRAAVDQIRAIYPNIVPDHDTGAEICAHAIDIYHRLSAPFHPPIPKPMPNTDGAAPRPPTPVLVHQAAFTPDDFLVVVGVFEKCGRDYNVVPRGY